MLKPSQIGCHLHETQASRLWRTPRMAEASFVPHPKVLRSAISCHLVPSPPSNPQGAAAAGGLRIWQSTLSLASAGGAIAAAISGTGRRHSRVSGPRRLASKVTRASAADDDAAEIAALQAEAARLKAEAEGERRVARARQILAGTERADEAALCLWLCETTGADEAGAADVARRLLLLSTAGVPPSMSVEDLASDAFDDKLAEALATWREENQKARKQRQEEEQVEDERLDEQSKWNTTPWKPENLNDDRSVSVRIMACLPFLLPLIDHVPFLETLAEAVPPLQLLLKALSGPYGPYHVLPLVEQLWWVLLTISANNREIPRLVRYGLQLAVNLDVAFFGVSVLAAILYGGAGGGGEVEDFEVVLGGYLYAGLLVSVLYSMGCCLLGRDPDGFPIVSKLTKDSLDGPPPPFFGSD